MRESRSIDGRWRLFGNRRAAHYGVLEYNPEKGLTLSVKIPKSRSFQSVIRKRRSVPKIIHGFDEHDHPITLFGCDVTSQKSSGGLVTYEISPIYALLGRHFSNGWDELTFNGATAKYSLLNDWLARSAIRQSQTPEGQPSVTHVAPPDITIPIERTITLTITTGISTHTALFSEYRLLQDHSIHLDFLDQPRPARTIYANYVLSFARLLTLFTGTRVYVDRLYFESKTAGGSRSRVELLGSNLGISEADRSSRAHARVQFREIQNSLPKIIKQWFANQDTYDPVLNLYFATIFVDSLYASHQFLFLAQALEVYHNSNPIFVNSVQTRTQFRQRVKRIVAKVSRSQRAWVREKLRHANQKTLAQRLGEILAAHRAEVRRFIKKPRQFADIIRHTRNYYTHFDPDLKRKGKIAEDTELFLLIIRMKALVNICILKDLGISGAPIDRIIETVKHIRIVSP